jgi:hypothetical protein
LGFVKRRYFNVIPRYCAAIASVLFAACVWAQAPGPGDPARVDIGNGFSVVAPTGTGWQKTAEPATYLKQLDEQGHSLVLAAGTGPSGITLEDIHGIGRGPGSGERLVKLVMRFVERAWKANATGMEQSRFERIEVVNETAGKYNIGKFICAYSRIRLLDRGAMVDGVPTQLRYVAYACIGLPDMEVAGHVSYSERGREQDLSDGVVAEGERFVRSLERGQ